MTPRLLIIDDDPGITAALSRGLAMHGYDTEAENRADRGLERLKVESFNGVICDVMLGADNGVELVRAARAAGVDVPIVMLSALSDVDQCFPVGLGQVGQAICMDGCPKQRHYPWANGGVNIPSLRGTNKLPKQLKLLEFGTTIRTR